MVVADRLKEKTISNKGKQIDRWYSGKAHSFGGNIQALFTPSGFPLWVSAVLPGGFIGASRAAGSLILIFGPATPCCVRCLGERGFALMSQRWRTLQRVMLSPGKIGEIAQATLVLVQFEHKMIT